MPNPKRGPRGGQTTVTENWRRTTVYLEPTQIRLLKEIALREDTSVSEILRRAVDLYAKLEGYDVHFSDYQREMIERTLRGQTQLTPEHIEELLQAITGGVERTGG